MTIYTENILNIAKFMGILPIKGFNEFSGIEYYYYNNIENRDYEPVPLYDTWDELMPVLCKIEEDTLTNMYVHICENVVLYGIKRFIGINKFDAIFKFISYWVNENFKQNNYAEACR